MLQAISDDVAPDYLRKFLELAAQQCQWSTQEFEQLKAGALPESPAITSGVQSIGVIMQGFPHIADQLADVMRKFGAEQLEKLASTKTTA